MAYRLRWSPTAQQDLRNFAGYIAESNPSAARRFVQRVVGLVERLSDFPELGRVVPEFDDPEIREMIRRPCRIIYRIKADERLIEIVRIWHSARGEPDIRSAADSVG